PRLLAVLCTLPAAAQNTLQINEIDFDEQWIEVANFDSRPADLTEWSLYQATHSTNLPGAYWWPFPVGLVLPPGEVLRVRWLNPVQQGNTNPLLLDTGATSWHFLFFLRGEPLDRAGGALALVSTQRAERVNDPEVYRDFVAWGDPAPYPREDLAVQNGRWLPGARTAPPLPGHSLAFGSHDLGEPTPPDAFFRDASPTPGSANHAGEATALYGYPCVLGLGPPSHLSFASLPVHGNVDFRVTADALGTGHTLFAFVFGLPDEAGTPWLAPCRCYVAFPGPLVVIPAGVTGERAELRPDLGSVHLPPRLAIQGVGLRANGSTVMTNGGLMTR